MNELSMMLFVVGGGPADCAAVAAPKGARVALLSVRSPWRDGGSGLSVG